MVHETNGGEVSSGLDILLLHTGPDSLVSRDLVSRMSFDALKSATFP